MLNTKPVVWRLSVKNLALKNFLKYTEKMCVEVYFLILFLTLLKSDSSIVVLLIF